MCRLRSYEINPPGGFLYVQTEGIKREFPSEPVIESQAQAVSAFRRGNGLPRAGVRECIEDVDRWNASRLGCNRSWCVAADSPTEAHTISIANSHPLITKSTGGVCSGCGAQLFSVPA